MIEYFLVFILGLIFGSFFNMLIYRIPSGIPLFNPKRSICPKCKSQIAWYNNIPLLSFLLLKGKCAQCKTPISYLYPFVELFTALTTLILFINFGATLGFILHLLFFYTFILLCFMDLKFKAVPDYLLFALFIFSFFITQLSILEALKAATMVAGAFVLLNFIISFYIQNIKARVLKDQSLKTQEALGEGDIPVLASMGVVLGLELCLIAIFLSAIFAIIPSFYNLIYKKDIEIPFIPYLFIGFILAFGFKDTIFKILGMF